MHQQLACIRLIVKSQRTSSNNTVIRFIWQFLWQWWQRSKHKNHQLTFGENFGGDDGASEGIRTLDFRHHKATL